LLHYKLQEISFGNNSVTLLFVLASAVQIVLLPGRHYNHSSLTAAGGAAGSLAISYLLAITKCVAISPVSEKQF